MNIRLLKIVNSLKIVHRKLKISSKGEIATALTLISLGLMLLGAVAGTRLATTVQQTKILAAYPDWNWDEASVGCTDATCICGNISRINNRQSGGVCTPVCKLDGTQKCISNKWDDSWGCWGDAALDCKLGLASPTPAGPTPTGPTPTAGSGGDPPSADCTAGEWKCNNNEANSDTKNLFCSVWCDGRNQWLYEASRAYFDGDGTKCGGKASAPRSGGCPDTATPVPTRPPGGGGPGPGGGNDTPKSGGYLVVRSGPNGYIESLKLFSSPPKFIYVEPEDSVASVLSALISSQYAAFDFPSTYNYILDNPRFRYDLVNRINPLIVKLNFDSPSKIKSHLLLFNESILDSNKIVIPAGDYNICFPNFTPTPTGSLVNINWDKTAQDVSDKCKSSTNSNIIQIQNFDFDYVPPTPIPTTEPAKLSFQINGSTDDNRKAFKIYGSKNLELSSVLGFDYLPISLKAVKVNGSKIPIIIDKSAPYNFGRGTSDDLDTFTTESLVENKAINQINEFELNFQADLIKVNGSAFDIQFLSSCTKNYTLPIKIPKGGQSNNLGVLFSFVVEEPNVCYLNLQNTTPQFKGSANADFQTVMDEYSSGKISAIDVSKFVSQLTRVPGLQTVSCDPTKGECSAGF